MGNKEQNEKLTARGIMLILWRMKDIENIDAFMGEGFIDLLKQLHESIDMEFAQLSELRKELEEAKRGKWVSEGGLQIMPYLESKAKDDKISELQTQLAEAQRQKDEAVGLLNERHIGSIKTGKDEYEWYNRVSEFLTKISRLSSGETKPVNTSPEIYPGSWCYPLFKHMSDEHGKILTDSELHNIVEVVRKMDCDAKHGGYCESSCIWEPFKGGARCKKCGSVSPF